MWKYLFAFFLVGLLAFAPQVASAQMSVSEVALAGDVQDRDPINRFDPDAYCEKDQSQQATLPVIDSSVNSEVYVWTRIQSGDDGVLRHTWFMNEDNNWKEVAAIDLNVYTSPGFRTWSSKQLVPSLHIGEWMVEVSAGDDLSQVLCIMRFRVS
jgi:hypothetical protein